MHDAYYTPTRIANEMAAFSTQYAPKVIADFASGNGSLLKAATSRWNISECIAADIDRKVTDSLKLRHPAWYVSRCNFLSARSRKQARAVAAVKGRVDLVLLNPPYSCVGGTICESTHAGKIIKCSRAMAFLSTAVDYLSPTGEIVAILPNSSFTSEKDEVAWEILEEQFKIKRGLAATRGDFDGCFAHCSVVRLNRRSRKRLRVQTAEETAKEYRVSLKRGSNPIHSQVDIGRVLVHSTDLYMNRVHLNGHIGCDQRPSVLGPCLMFPRVGKPRIDKVALYKMRKRVVLSDCVFGIQCYKLDDAEKLHQRICKNPKAYYALYSGTCAQYTTIRRVREFLEHLGCCMD